MTDACGPEHRPCFNPPPCAWWQVMGRITYLVAFVKREGEVIDARVITLALPLPSAFGCKLRVTPIG